VKNGLGRIAVIAAALFSWTAAAACAEPVETSFSLTVNALNGKHEINGGQGDTLGFAPLPLGELTLRRGSESLRVEGLPPVTFGYSNLGDGAMSTRLSIVNATLRHTFAGGWFVGVGQTVYNQFTTYASSNSTFFYERGFVSLPINGNEAQYSRVTGPRFELGQGFGLGPEHLDVSAAVNPHMHGVQYTRIPTFNRICSGRGTSRTCGPYIVQTFADPENAAQVDLAARFSHRLSKHGALLYGLRYLNYSAHYDDYPGQLADRNVGFAPQLGYRVNF
jgi:hypothetical protein